jgi:nucleoid-associated protein YgaU
MRRAVLALCLAAATVPLYGCIVEEPVRPATAIPGPPTIVRPPLVPATTSPSPSPFADSRTYTVQAGDTLTSIAQRFYNDAGQWNRLFEANRDQLGSANDLRVGMTIRIPPASR